MGCDHYTLEERDPIHFSESDDSIRCCCTLARNEEPNTERVRALAYLGAAIVLMHHGELEQGYLPFCLPEKMRKAIDRCFKN